MRGNCGWTEVQDPPARFKLHMFGFFGAAFWLLAIYGCDINYFAYNNVHRH